MSQNLAEDQKTKKSSRAEVKVQTKQEKKTDERIAFLVTNLSLLALRLGEGPGPWLRLWSKAYINKCNTWRTDENVRMCCLFITVQLKNLAYWQ